VHRLTYIRIINYKSCIDASFDLADFTPLVGPNNGGKSNILSGVKWLVRGHALSSTDFNNPKEPVFIEAVISGITDEVLSRLEETHRKKIEPLCLDQTLEIRRYQQAPSRSVKDVELHVRDTGNGGWKKAPTGIPNAVTAILPDPIEIGAMEDAAEDAAKYKTSTTIGKLIADIVEPIQDEHGEAIRSELDGLRKKLSADGQDRPKQMQDFDKEANAVLRTFFPDVTIRLHIPTPELDDLFKTGTIKAYEQDGIGREITSLGHGAQRAVQMALVQCLADKSISATSGSTSKLLIVEEPELYMHPHGVEQVRVSLKTLSKAGYQVLVATHSPLVISSSDVADTLLIRKTSDQGTHARRTLRDAVATAMTDHPRQAEMLFSLSNSSQILFADRVVLAEGTTEHRLIPSLFEIARGRTLGLARIALISQGGVYNTPKSMQILRAMDLPCKAIVDLDFAFRGARTEGLLAEDDADIAKCKEIFAEIAAAGECLLDPEGLPTKGGALTSSEAFAQLATHKDAAPSIESLHAKLLEHDIWLWKLGAMDQHVGLESKSEKAWSSFPEGLHLSGLNSIPDKHGVLDLLEWLDKVV
jgi:putative ATP-dependent endonuclease of the OLD family